MAAVTPEAYFALKKKFDSVLHDNWELINQVEKYRNVIQKLSCEKR